MKKSLFLIVVVLAAVAIAADVAAQGAGQGKMYGWGHGDSYQRRYDPETVKTVSGEVTAVDYFTPEKGMGQGVHLQLKTEGETLSVHLGPRWYLDEQDVKIEKGDQITVKGSLITFKEKPTLIAAEVKKGEDTLQLRDDKGFPRWAGSRGKRQ